MFNDRESEGSSLEMPTVHVHTSLEGYWAETDTEPTHWVDNPGGLVAGGWKSHVIDHYENGNPIYVDHWGTNEIYMEFDTVGVLPLNAHVIDCYLAISVAPGLGRVVDTCNPDPDPGVGWLGSSVVSGYVFQHENGTPKTYQVANTAAFGVVAISMDVSPPCDPKPPEYYPTTKMIVWSGTASGLGGPTLVITYEMPGPPGGAGGPPPLGYRFEGLWLANRIDGSLTIGYELGIVTYPNLTTGARYEEKVNMDGTSAGVGQSLRLLINLASVHDLILPSVAYDMLVELIGTSVNNAGTLAILVYLALGATALKTYNVPVTGKRDSALLLPRVGRIEELLLEFLLADDQKANVEDCTLTEVSFGVTKQKRIGTR
jgi:hypothetical protein